MIGWVKLESHNPLNPARVRVPRCQPSPNTQRLQVEICTQSFPKSWTQNRTWFSNFDKISASAWANSLIIVSRLASDIGVILQGNGFAHTRKPSLYAVTKSTSGSIALPVSSTCFSKEHAQRSFEMARKRLRSPRWMPGHSRRPGQYP